MGDENPCITLGDWGRVDNLDEVSLGFHPVNPVVFDLKNNVIINLKSNQFSGNESEDPVTCHYPSNTLLVPHGHLKVVLTEEMDRGTNLPRFTI